MTRRPTLTMDDLRGFKHLRVLWLVGFAGCVATPDRDLQLVDADPGVSQDARPHGADACPAETCGSDGPIRLEASVAADTAFASDAVPASDTVTASDAAPASDAGSPGDARRPNPRDGGPGDACMSCGADLSGPHFPVCGDGTCDLTENCEACAPDCLCAENSTCNGDGACVVLCVTGACCPVEAQCAVVGDLACCVPNIGCSEGVACN